MSTNLASCLIAFSALISGCTTLKPESVVTPSEVSVGDALRSVAQGLADMKVELDRRNFVTGLLVDEVTLTLNLTSKASDSKALAVDVSKLLSPGTAGLSGKVLGLSSVETAEGLRGSILVIKMKNASLVDIKNPDIYKRISPLAEPGPRQ